VFCSRCSRLRNHNESHALALPRIFDEICAPQAICNDNKYSILEPGGVLRVCNLERSCKSWLRPSTSFVKMSHLPARRAYQDSSPDQPWQLNGRSMLMDVQGGEFLLDDSVIDVHPPPVASRIPKPSANAQPKPVDDRTPRPAHPRPSMLPITSKPIERGPQTARRRRINSTKDANRTPVQLSIPLPETVDNMVVEHTIVQGSRPASSHSRTQQPISPPEISSPVPGGGITVPPALPDFTSSHTRKPSATNTAIPLRQPKSILKRPKSTNLLQPLQPLESGWDEVQVEEPDASLLVFRDPCYPNLLIPRCPSLESLRLSMSRRMPPKPSLQCRSNHQPRWSGRPIQETIL
jgi:hypothetical protein